MMCVMAFLIIIVCSYCLYAVERTIDYDHYILGLQDTPTFFIDYLWLLIITVLTVGYGDIYPKSHLGRVFALVAATGGLLLTATLITVFNTCLNLNLHE